MLTLLGFLHELGAGGRVARVFVRHMTGCVRSIGIPPCSLVGRRLTGLIRG